MLAVAFGLGLGTVAGLSVGPQIFPRILKPKDLSFLDESADGKDDVEVPEPGTKIGSDMRRLLDYTEPWTTNPDYQRVSMINRMIKIMWPTLTKAILDTVLVEVKKQLEKQVFSNPKLSFVEDIVFGTDAMHPSGVKDFSKWVKDKVFTVGSIPPRVGGIKLYDTSEDEVIIEVPLLFGSNVKINVGVFLRAGPLRLYVPVEVSNVHFKGDARITLKPLVDTIPCIGGATVSLMQVPHVDFTLKVVGGVDLMALPIVKDAIRHATKMVMEGMLVQPNSMSFPIMPNFGLMPPAKGAINIKLLRGEKLKDMPLYVEVEIRKGRGQYSKTVEPVAGKAEYGEEFNLIVDDYEAQSIHLRLYKDDLGWNDSLIGKGEVKFGEYEKLDLAPDEDEEAAKHLASEFKLADFIKIPMQEQLIEVKLKKPKKEAKGMVAGTAGAVMAAPGQALSGVKGFGKSLQRILTKKRGPEPSPEPSVAVPVVDKDRGSLYLKVMFMPFFQPTYDDEDEDEVADGPDAAAASSVASPPGAEGEAAGAAVATASALQQAKSKRSKAKKKSAVTLPSVRQITTKVHDKLKGVLTITLIRCINLNGDDVNSYVHFLVSDEDHDKVQRSQVVYSQNSPRWGQKFDFVMITAGSSLFMTVYGKRGLTSNMLGAVNSLNVFAKKKTDEEKDKVLGKLEIRVRDVVRNGTIKDTWTLQDAEKGQIEAVLSWQTCYISDD